MQHETLEIEPKAGIDPEALARHILKATAVRSCQVVRGNIRITFDASSIAAKKLVKFIATYRTGESRTVKRNITKIIEVKA
jgi:hypothetical protein